MSHQSPGVSSILSLLSTRHPKNSTPYSLSSMSSQTCSNRHLHIPTVSIGLPVFNGENFLEDAITSLLNQTYKDFELIISDNDSTDKTEEICQRFASQDQRVRYYRSDINHGPAWNYNRVFKLSRGKYFKWAAHDDICAPELIEKCVFELEKNQALILCFSKVNVIDAETQFIEQYNVSINLDAPSPHVRFGDLSSLRHRCYEIFGLIRADVLEQTPLIDRYAGSDRVLLARLSLYGPFKVLPEYLFGARMHAQQSIAMLRQPRNRHLRLHDYAAWFDPENKGKIIFPNWRILYEHGLSIQVAPLTWRQKLACYRTLVLWTFSYWNWAKLIRDILIATILKIIQVRNNIDQFTEEQFKELTKTSISS